MSLRCQVQCKHGTPCWRICGHDDPHVMEDDCACNEVDVVRWDERASGGTLELVPAHPPIRVQDQPSEGQGKSDHLADALGWQLCPHDILAKDCAEHKSWVEVKPKTVTLTLPDDPDDPDQVEGYIEEAWRALHRAKRK